MSFLYLKDTVDSIVNNTSKQDIYRTNIVFVKVVIVQLDYFIWIINHTCIVEQ